RLREARHGTTGRLQDDPVPPHERQGLLVGHPPILPATGLAGDEAASQFLCTSRIPPLTVARASLRPPAPIVPVSSRRLVRAPASSKSPAMRPLTVRASTAVLASLGRASVMLPLTVWKEAESLQSVRPR